MTVTIWGMIRLIENDGAHGAAGLPSLQGLVCFGDTKTTPAFSIPQTRCLEGLRTIAADRDLQGALATGHERVVAETVNVAAGLSRSELLNLYREVAQNRETMRLFATSQGLDCAVHPGVLLWGGEGEQMMEADSETELKQKARVLLNDARIERWVRAQTADGDGGRRTAVG